VGSELSSETFGEAQASPLQGTSPLCLQAPPTMLKDFDTIIARSIILQVAKMLSSVYFNFLEKFHFIQNQNLPKYYLSREDTSKMPIIKLWHCVSQYKNAVFIFQSGQHFRKLYNCAQLNCGPFQIQWFSSLLTTKAKVFNSK